ncbi:uncharacterized protein LAJ45_10597 [Morchella importuna]|uniref:uncharacterized protein n=1 Tax=Morchella importuna TaxID=1174673 RepID=UPI001E8CA4DC|nr:uncharacterized protein LAJ45_10597 [Morchella importuna]KAH8145317.1 hypothetical protein LAJ45_10597 [Morchella importuna]
MSVTNGGGGMNGTSGANGHLGSKMNISDEDYKTYEKGVQVIDENKEFTPNLPTYLAIQNLISTGFNYHVVAVFGSQSTGKSTLLNHLFGTQFSVMDEAARRQTTKGIWMSRALDEQDHEQLVANREGGMTNNILVMDVEGTDGRERGEDQDFERKSALFALATSEVLIVNIWEHQVGLYQGANMGLLKTVFEVNLGLFLKDKSTTHRSLLFFVIRDHIGHTPLEGLKSTLMADLNKIWSSLSKPAGMEESEITDFFDFQFAALPHKILQPEKFLEETKALRTKFREGVDVQVLSDGSPIDDNNNGVFLPAYHRRIPADGFPLYAEGVWEQIVSNKDLDLPSQQELLAQFRCDEIAASCVAGFNEIIQPFEELSKKGGVLDGLGPAMKKALGEAVGGFEEAGGRYHKGVFGRKRDELRAGLEGRLRVLVINQFTALSKRGLAEFTEEITAILKKANSTAHAGTASYDFATVVDETRKLEGLQKDLDAVAGRLRGEEMKRLVSRLEKAIKVKLIEPIELEFRRMEDNTKEKGGLWDRVWNVWVGVVGDGVDTFLSRATSFNASEKERDVGAWKLKKKAWGVLKAKIDEEVHEGNLLLKLREKFEDRFRYDETGVPRVWKPTDDIEGSYTKALDATLKLIPLVSEMRLSNGQQPPLDEFLGDAPADYEEDLEELGPSKDEFEVISESKRIDLHQRFKRMADAVFVEAKRSTINGVAQIPMFMWGLVLALGWNEIWAVLRSPVYFAFLLLCCFVVYVVYRTNLWGPIYQVSNAMSQQAVDIGKQRLREFLSDNGNAAFAGRTNKTRGYDDDDDAISLQSLDTEGRRRVKRETSE